MPTGPLKRHPADPADPRDNSSTASDANRPDMCDETAPYSPTRQIL